MEQYIADLEEKHIAKLESYLKVTGLENYSLTPIEEKVINEYKDLEFIKYNITEIFDIKNTKNILSRDIEENSGTIPYLCASAENNAVSSYINYKENLKDKGNCIFIGGKTFVVSYQEKDFYSNDSHNLALYLKRCEKTKFNQLYLVTCLKRSLSYKYSWGDSISSKKIKKEVIALPTRDGKLDFDTMQTFITAVYKLVIKDVVLYVKNKCKEIYAYGETNKIDNLKVAEEDEKYMKYN